MGPFINASVVASDGTAVKSAGGSWSPLQGSRGRWWGDHPHFWKSPMRWQRQLEPHRLQRQDEEWQQSPGRWSQLPPRRTQARLKT